MSKKNRYKIRPDWFSKTFAGLVLGLTFSMALGVLLCMLGEGHIDRMLLPQMGMWLVPWLWMPLFFAAYFFPKGWQVLLCYLTLNAVAYGLVFLVRA